MDCSADDKVSTSGGKIESAQSNEEKIYEPNVEMTQPNKGDPEDVSTVNLSEYLGDELPHPMGQVHREVSLEATDLREGDLLLASRFYKRTPDIMLVSLLKDFKKGEFITYQYKAPLSMFSLQPKLGNAFIYRSGAFKTVKFSIDRIRLSSGSPEGITST